MEKILKIIIWPIFIAPLIYVALIWNKLPETIPTHFNIQGVPDEYGKKAEIWVPVIILTASSLFSYFLVSNVYRIDPKKGAQMNKTKLHRMAFITSVFMSLIGCLIINATLTGGSKFISRLIMACVGILFTFIGNYIYSIKPNYFAGLRLPWTLENEENWRKTHILAGKLFFAAGLLIAIIALFLPMIVSIIAVFSLIAAIIIITIIYSYGLYKKQKKTSTPK